MLEHAAIIGLGIFAAWHLIRDLDVIPEWAWHWAGPLLIVVLAVLGVLAPDHVVLAGAAAGVAGLLTIGKNRIEEGKPVVAENLGRGRYH